MLDSGAVLYLKSKLMDTGLLCRGPDAGENDEEFNRLSANTQTSARTLRESPEHWVITLGSDAEIQPKRAQAPVEFKVGNGYSDAAALEEKSGQHNMVSRLRVDVGCGVGAAGAGVQADRAAADRGTRRAPAHVIL